MLSGVYPTGLKSAVGDQLYLHTSRNIDESKRARLAVLRRADVQATLNSVLRLSLGDHSLEEQLGAILDEVTSIPWLAPASKGAIFLVEDDPEVLVMKAQRDLAEVLLTSCARAPFGRCLCGRAAAEKRVVFRSNVDGDHDVMYEGMLDHGHYCVPLLNGHKLLGVMTLYVRAGHKRNDEEVAFLESVADVVAGVLERCRVREEAEENLRKFRAALAGVVQALEATVEWRDPYTAGHQGRVAQIAVAIGTQMMMPEDQIQAIRMAAGVHDVGKICVPAEILSKPGRLTDAEFSLVRSHAQVGFEILSRVEVPWPLATIAHQHHERMDGSGYPCGLAGDEVMIEARVIAVADVIEAMASHRPYRASLGMDKACAEISAGSGTRYDPDVVRACLAAVRLGTVSLD